MLLSDRRKLKRLMAIQRISHRKMASLLGWKAHSYVGRLVRGEVTSVDAEAAVLIAHRLGVPVDELFVTRVTGESARIDRKIHA